MDKDSSEIVKLTERMAKDPKSKLFVPLAEEYKKTGDIAKAVSILREGLKNNPGYVTARSVLGRLLMESGDLVGAQKEFEEVIKAIPDNLLAQRKLGDLYVLQGRSDEALKRYKAALTLNPGDKEVSAFVVDLEAGRDISGRIARPKSVSPSAVAGTGAAPTAAASSQKTSPAAPAQARSAAQPAAGGPKPAATAGPSPSQHVPAGPSAAATPIKETPQRPKPTPERAPVPEPLQEQQAKPSPKPAPPLESPKMPETVEWPPAAAAPASAGGRSAETIEEIVELEPLEHLAAEAAALQDVSRSSPKSSSLPEPPPAEPLAGAFDLSEPSNGAFARAEEQQPLEWVPPSEPASALAAETRTDESKDDINTDTLAELYITQAFYEKAIEIYERMLSERPGTAALEQKLQRLRSLAAAAEKAGTVISRSGDVSAGAPGLRTGASVLPFSADAEGPSPMNRGAIPAMPVPSAEAPPVLPAGKSETVEPEPASTAETRAGTTKDDSLKAMQEALEGAERPKPAQAPVAEQGSVRAPQTATVRRKETIDRLELWLKNVMKEKPQ